MSFIRDLLKKLAEKAELPEWELRSEDSKTGTLFLKYHLDDDDIAMMHIIDEADDELPAGAGQ